MKISQVGIDAIKRHEALRLWAYLDSASVPTIGWGHTSGVQLGDHIDEATAEVYLRADLSWAQSAINNLVRVPMTQPAFDALVSFVFNVGETAFKGSTLLAKINGGDTAGAADEFLRWDKATVGGVKTVLPGLASRRKAERAMFVATHTPAAPENAATASPGLPPGDPAQYSQEGGMPIPAIVTALLPTVVQMIPRLATIFKPGSEVAARNVAAATAVIDMVTQATGSVNAQAAVEAIQSNPAALAKATKAVEDGWFQLHKAAEESTAAARQFGVTYAQTQDVRTVIGKLTFLEVLSLLLVVSTLAGGMAVLIWGGIDAQLKGAVVTLMLIGGFTGVTQFWFGSSLGSKKKDDKA